MSGRVLIVEDESIVADDLGWKVTQLGYDVVGIAASSDEALEIAEQQRPHIVLMDVQLQDGVAGTETARAIQNKTGAAIIFVTAYAVVFLKDPGAMPAPGICLSKPFSILQLKTALQSVEITDS